jgi:hypothetical protein
MTTTTFQAFVREPFDLALTQPHQMLISSASVAIVASEAATLIPYPFNILLAIGAEWAYLRGLISGAGVRTRWAAALNTSAVLLVVLYGSLWGFRSFHLIPDAPPPWAAVLLTIVHIGAIGAVTICSAMLHRAGEDAKAAIRRIAADRETARQRRFEDERDALALEMERKRQELAIWEQGMEAKARLKMQSQNARTKMRRDALPASTNAVEQTCPKCATLIEARSAWLAARRWGHCPACKETATR